MASQIIFYNCILLIQLANYKKKTIKKFTFLLTRGIVFDLGDRQIAFEKDIWFSEEIIVHRGYNLTGCFSSTENFGDDWDKSLRTECIREEIIIQ